MKTKKHINKIISELKNIWLKHPELRLGQLLINLKKEELLDFLYYVEDEQLIKKLKDFYL